MIRDDLPTLKRNPMKRIEFNRPHVRGLISLAAIVTGLAGCPLPSCNGGGGGGDGGGGGAPPPPPDEQLFVCKFECWTIDGMRRVSTPSEETICSTLAEVDDDCEALAPTGC